MPIVTLESSKRCSRYVDGRIEVCPGVGKCFKTQFEDDVLTTSPRKGTLLRNTVREWIPRYGGALKEVETDNVRRMRVECQACLRAGVEGVDPGYVVFSFRD